MKMRIRSRHYASYLPFTPDDVLVGGQLAQAHRAARVQLLRRDPDLGAEAELLAVGEARARVHDDRRRVDLVREAAGRVEIAREDRLGVPGAVAVDVRDRGVEIGRDRDRHLQVEELAAEVVVGRGADVRRAALRPRRRRRARRPARAARRRRAGTNASATAACTTSDSAALHTLGRCVLALTTISQRLVEIGRASTYT